MICIVMWILLILLPLLIYPGSRCFAIHCCNNWSAKASVIITIWKLQWQGSGQRKQIISKVKLRIFPSLSANAGITAQKLPVYQLTIEQSTCYTWVLRGSWCMGCCKALNGRTGSLAAKRCLPAYYKPNWLPILLPAIMHYRHNGRTIADNHCNSWEQETGRGNDEDLKRKDVVTGAAVVQSQANQYSVAITIPT